MVVGAGLVVLVVGVSVGFVGRVLMPGRHGLAQVMWRDPRLAPRIVLHDDEVWWELGGGVLGAIFGYIGGRWIDSYTLGATPLRWYLSVIGAVALVGIAIASGAIERSRTTRRLGIHHRAVRGGAP